MARPRPVIRHVIAAAAAALLALAAGGCGSTDDPAPVVLAVTTSTEDSGLVEVLAPAFERRTGRSVKSIVLGSGQALRLARRGEVDVVLAHSPSAERRLMASGVAGRRRLVMRNDFVLVGPSTDPAEIRGLGVLPALRRIAGREERFASRGDDSGTHVFELGLWKRAGVEPAAPWRLETGQGQSATLQVAAERAAYALTDRGTYLASGVARDLPVVVDGGVALHNPYHVIDMTEKAGSRVDAAGGRAFADWLVSVEAQRIIADFGRGRFGRSLFVPMALRRQTVARA